LSEAIIFEQQVSIKWNLEGFGVRVGVDTGPVIVGGGIEAELTALGMTVNLAARMEQTAPAGALQITHETYQQVYGLFDVEPQPLLKVKGKEEPIQTYLVLSARPRIFRMDRYGIAGLEAPMIGRDNEFSYLCSLFHDTRQQRRVNSITILGEPGIGKSRLLDEFDKWLGEQVDHERAFRARGFRARQSSPYWMIRMLIANYCRIQDSDGSVILLHKLETHLSRYLGEDSSKKIQIIGALLGFTFGDGQIVGVSQEGSLELQDQALHYLNRFFSEVLLEGTTVLLLEDIHWADRPSLEFLKDLETSRTDRPLLILYFTRPELLNQSPNWFVSREAMGIPHSKLELLSLVESDSQRLVSEILSEIKDLPLPLVESISVRSDGNPLFIEELIKILIEDGVIKRAEIGHPWHVDHLRLGMYRIPPTLTAVLESRLDRLSLTEKELIQKAAIVGRTFWKGALTELGGKDDEIEPLLNKLVSRDLIYRENVSTFMDQAEFSFKHVLLRDVTYATVLMWDRTKHHAQTADWLYEVTEETGRQDEYSAVIAEHYEFGERPELAADWYLRAGQMASKQGAPAEANDFFDHAIDLLPAESRRRRMSTLFAKENVLGKLGIFEAQHELVQRIIEIANELDDEYQLAAAYGRLGLCNRNLGWNSEEIEAYDTSINFARQSDNRLVEAHSLSLLAHTLLRQGDPVKASRMADEALQIANELDDEAYEAKALTNIGAYYSDSGDIGNAAKLFSKLVPICSRLELAYGEAVNLSNLGYNYALIGLPELAIPQLEQAITISESIGARQLEAYCQLNLGLANYRLGATESAQVYLEESLDATTKYGDRFGKASANLYLALTNEQYGEHSSAAALFKRAMKLFDEIGFPGYSTDAKAGLARCYYGQQEYHEARELTDSIWEHLRNSGSQGMEFPSLAFLTCVHTYINLGEEDLSKAAEEAGHGDLMERAEKISDPLWRQSYENRIPEHYIFIRDIRS
jgi:tetratricopeptide (TPR) repeat protein